MAVIFWDIGEPAAEVDGLELKASDEMFTPSLDFFTFWIGLPITFGALELSLFLMKILLCLK